MLINQGSDMSCDQTRRRRLKRCHASAGQMQKANVQGEGVQNPHHRYYIFDAVQRVKHMYQQVDASGATPKAAVGES